MKIFSHKLYVVLFFIVVALSACEKDINITLPYAGDKIAVNAILTSDSFVFAHITKSAPTEKSQLVFEELKGCKADLYENDVLKETLVESVINGKRYYVSANKVSNNAKYTIKVSYNGLNSVEGSDLIPVKPYFLPMEFWRTPTRTPNNETMYKLTIKLKDPAGVKNYYRMHIFPTDYNTTTQGYTINKFNGLNFSIENFAKQGGIFGSFDDNFDRIKYFTDETFDGEEVTLNISIKSSEGRIYVAPEVTQLSRSAYLYFDSKNKQQQSQDNPFAEAVVVYNNIKNGYGIVGGVADSITVIKRNN